MALAVTRHAAVLAWAIQTVEEFAPGRVKLIIGTGYTSASTIGRKPATLAPAQGVLRRCDPSARHPGRPGGAPTPFSPQVQTADNRYYVMTQVSILFHRQMKRVCAACCRKLVPITYR